MYYVERNLRPRSVHLHTLHGRFVNIKYSVSFYWGQYKAYRYIELYKPRNDIKRV